MNALTVENLSIRHQDQILLEPVSFTVGAGQCIVVLGESGSGKSLLAQAILGLLPHGLAADGSVILKDQRFDAGDTALRRQRWGRELGLLPQEPWRALNPTMRIGDQVAEVHALVRGRPWAEARSTARAALADMGLADEYRSLPHRLSGGMAQRATLAAARAGGASILIADEPTKGLDIALRSRVVDDLKSVMVAGGTLFVITHDVQVARDLGGEVIVMRGGQLMERGPGDTLLTAPASAYTRELLAADPASWPTAAAPPAHGDMILAATDLAKTYDGKQLFAGLDLSLSRGDRVAFVGASGSGKSTLGDILIGVRKPDRGSVRRGGGLSALAFQKLHQDPGAAFAPSLSLARALNDAVRLHGRKWQDVRQWMRRLGLSESLLPRKPAALSSGELQRFALLRILLVRPALIFADEPTSRLDPINQRRALELLAEVAAEENIALLLVTHDPDVARAIAPLRLHLPLTAQ
ncbi:ATP-binding cassette domain-containing protein [Altererythrobacter xixiisoli]|uniref:ATP-binding cassette domain-containing protein n=1 Tax=Croceibacterium xixiisoli TaxID=1476466 RepID=A0A6I4TWD2_9SPHN|nr:ATP-binding cassette domain-containing protein [Croceibacterium xixiisoli]MXP00305.1 ATP-binding cassette domain-containing protein [Croceibacterium xixiisoli]